MDPDDLPGADPSSMDFGKDRERPKAWSTIWGAGQGVGEGIARALAEAGAAVVIAARRAENGEPAAAAIRERGHAASFVRCDVTLETDTGTYECFLYTVKQTKKGPAGEVPMVTRYWFSKAHPGPPLQIVTDTSGVETSRQTLVSDEGTRPETDDK